MRRFGAAGRAAATRGSLLGPAVRSAAPLAGALACMALLAAGAQGSPSRARASIHFACSGPNAAHVPCRFSTPSGNIRCLWTPKPNNVVCELLATGRAYRLRPTGHARRVTIALHRRGETLPTSQQLVFPEALSCKDTRTTMTCSQDFGLGQFRLAPHGSRAS